MDSFILRACLDSATCALSSFTLPAHELQEQSTQLRPLNITVVVVNPSPAVSDCIHEVFARRGLAVLSGTRISGERLKDPVLLGELELAAMEALTLSCQFGVDTTVVSPGASKSTIHFNALTYVD